MQDRARYCTRVPASCPWSWHPTPRQSIDGTLHNLPFKLHLTSNNGLCYGITIPYLIEESHVWGICILRLSRSQYHARTRCPSKLHPDGRKTCIQQLVTLSSACNKHAYNKPTWQQSEGFDHRPSGPSGPIKQTPAVHPGIAGNLCTISSKKQANTWLYTVISQILQAITVGTTSKSPLPLITKWPRQSGVSVGAAPPTSSQLRLQRHTQVPAQDSHNGCQQPTLDPLQAHVPVCQASPF